jgi:hypothetical protein
MRPRIWQQFTQELKDCLQQVPKLVIEGVEILSVAYMIAQYDIRTDDSNGAQDYVWFKVESFRANGRALVLS